VVIDLYSSQCGWSRSWAVCVDGSGDAGGQAHFDDETGLKNQEDQDELGWQMSVAAATALSSIGVYRVVRADLRRR
jgi:hypothetical protein